MTDDPKKLAELLAEIAKHEAEMDISRNTLYQKDSFAPKVIFRHITDSDTISPSRLKEFLDSHQESVSESDIEIFFQINDRDDDGVLGLGEFLYTFASRAFSLEAKVQAGDNDPQVDEKQAGMTSDLVRVASQEVTTIWKVLASLLNSGYFESAETLAKMLLLFQSYPSNSLSEKELRSFVGSCHIPNSNQIAQMVISRLDLDGDGKLSEKDWHKWQQIILKYRGEISIRIQKENQAIEGQAQIAVSQNEEANQMQDDNPRKDGPIRGDPDSPLIPDIQAEGNQTEAKVKSELEQFTEFPIERMSGEDVRLTNHPDADAQAAHEPAGDTIPDNFVSDPDLRIRDIEEKLGDVVSPGSHTQRQNQRGTQLKDSEILESVQITADFTQKRSSDNRGYGSSKEMVLRNEIRSSLSKLHQIMKSRERKRRSLANNYSVCLTQIFELIAAISLSGDNQASCDFKAFSSLFETTLAHSFSMNDMRAVFRHHAQPPHSLLQQTAFLSIFLPRELSHKRRALDKTGDPRVRRLADVGFEGLAALGDCLRAEADVLRWVDSEARCVLGRLHELFDLIDKGRIPEISKLPQTELKELLNRKIMAIPNEELEEIVALLQHQSTIDRGSHESVRETRPFLRSSYHPSHVFSRQSIERLSAARRTTFGRSSFQKQRTEDTYFSDRIRNATLHRSPEAYRQNEYHEISPRYRLGNHSNHREISCLGADSSCVWRKSTSNPTCYLPTARYEPALAARWPRNSTLRFWSDRKNDRFNSTYNSPDYHPGTRLTRFSTIHDPSNRNTLTSSSTHYIGDWVIRTTRTTHYPSYGSVAYY